MQLVIPDLKSVWRASWTATLTILGMMYGTI